jgi:hypothetical protein
MYRNINNAGMELGEKVWYESVFATARMYNREQPKMALEKIFGVTSFEVG